MHKRNNRGTWGSILALSAAAAVAAFIVVAPSPVAGQFGGGKGGKQAAPPGPVPRTPEGKPDMSGFWGGVQPGGVTSIEPAKGRGGPGGGKGAPKGGPAAKGGPGGAKGGPAAAKGGFGGRGGARANAITDPEDGLVPYTDAARAKSDDIIANRMFLEPELHCYMSGVPHNMWVQFGGQTFQTPDYIVFTWEFQHSRRIIPLDNRPHQLPATVHQFQGESVGHWEGDTLVVDTTNQTHHTWFDTSGHFAPEDIHVVERFTMVNADQIDYEAVVTSAKEFTQPMTVTGTIRRSQQNDPSYEQMEFGCIEGNQDLQHYTEDKGGQAKNVGARTQ